MTLREVDQLIAEKIMGWRWWTRSAYPSRWFGPPAGAVQYQHDSLTGTVGLCTDDDMLKLAEAPWWLETIVGHSSKAECVPCYTTQFDAAFLIRDHIHKNWLFSWRQNFIYHLQVAIGARLRMDVLPHVSEIIMQVKPHDICAAALLVRNIPVPEELRRIETSKP